MSKSLLALMGFKPKRFIKSVASYKFPEVVMQRTQETLKLNDEEMDLLALSLLTYFNAVKYSPRGVDMTDTDVDELWHNFLLDTRSYMDFCSKYIGFYIHHSPYIETKELDEDDMKSISIKYGNALDQDIELYETLMSKNHYTSEDDKMKFFPFFYMLLTGKMVYKGA